MIEIRLDETQNYAGEFVTTFFAVYPFECRKLNIFADYHSHPILLYKFGSWISPTEAFCVDSMTCKLVLIEIDLKHSDYTKTYITFSPRTFVNIHDSLDSFGCRNPETYKINFCLVEICSTNTLCSEHVIGLYTPSHDGVQIDDLELPGE